MFEKLIGNNVKIVYKDGEENKASRGIIKAYRKDFIELEDQDTNTTILNINHILTIKTIDLKGD